VSHETIASVVEAGADLLVAGSAVFDSGRPEHEARVLLKLAQEAEQGRREQNFHSRRAAAI
jgi:ribulose-phosphate 3-epimerase